MTEFKESTGVSRRSLVVVVVVLALAVVGLVVAVAVVASQLAQAKDAELAASRLVECDRSSTPSCVHLCTNTHAGARCACRDGYRLAGDGRNCEDIDECLSGIHSCDHECTNGEGSYNCSCRFGYTLHEDGKQCLTVPRPRQLSLGSFAKVAVSSAQRTCNQIATALLAGGGSVVDAAVAAELCEGVMSPHYFGIGGGFMMTVYAVPRGEREKRLETLVARETAPAAATQDMYSQPNASSVTGGLSVGVPGDIAGLYAAWERYGRLPWADVVAPAARLARRGFPMNSLLQRALKVQAASLQNFPEIAAVFLPDGAPAALGAPVRLPRLASTLETVAAEGAAAFYNGSLADDIVADIRDAGGIITREDLAGYRPAWKTPVSTKLTTGNLTMHGPPPPSGAAVVQFVLNILDGYNITSADLDDPLLAHRLVEAMKFGYGKRSALGDEDFVNVTQLLEELTSNERGEYYRGKINDERTSDDLDYYEHRFAATPDAGTSHFALIGPDGSAVSLTSTINYYFGSKVLGSRTGIIFNNQMDDFSSPGATNTWGFAPSPTNYIVPGKRPMSSTSPLLVTDAAGTVRLVVGGAGGARIISNVINTAVNALWLGVPLDQAVNRPRLHHQLLPPELRVEANMPQNIIDFLQSRNHTVLIPDSHRFFGGVMAAANTCHACDDVTACDVKCLKAAGDWRTDEGGNNMAPHTDGY